MKIQYRSRTFDVDPSTFIKRANVYWAGLEIGNREGVKAVHYVAVPNMTDMIYTCAEPPVDQHWQDVQQARIEWNWKHVFVTPEQATSISAADNVRLCIRKPEPVISLYAESMVAA